MAFTAHNIVLPDGTQTLPSAVVVEDDGRFQAPVRLLKLVFPDGLRGKSIADLGCLEGGYAAGFARLGMAATGFEIRDSNLENCRYVKSQLGLDNLSFIKEDVNNIHLHGPFDAIFAQGIFYHLDKPREFLERAASVCRKIIFIETHFTYDYPSAGAQKFGLSELCENEGLMGRWYAEHDYEIGPDLDDKKWASWENKRSFWLQKEHLLNLIRNVGFDVVLEQYDIHDHNIVEGMKSRYYVEDRGLFVGIRS